MRIEKYLETDNCPFKTECSFPGPGCSKTESEKCEFAKDFKADFPSYLEGRGMKNYQESIRL